MSTPANLAFSGEAGAIPALGFGTSPMTGGLSAETVLAALKAGYRHIDTARKYGSERAVGEAMRASGLARQEIFLTTKVSHENLRPNDFVRSVDESLAALEVGYVDLLLVHWPNPQIAVAEYMPALAKAKRELTAEANFNEHDTGHFTLRYEGAATKDTLRQQIIEAGAKVATTPTLGITGTGGAGKSSLTDELVRRFRLDQEDSLKLAIISIDPSRKRTGGALLGDRIRMNAIEHPNIFMRSLATRDTGSEVSAALPEVIAACKLSGFDLVSGVLANGFSDYYAVTAAVERKSTVGLGLRASYTYSRTNDNWMLGPTGDPADQLTPFPEEPISSDWADGRSDLDIPHRLVVTANYTLPGKTGLDIALRYRFRSGLPFTPGFRPGVDMNGDGSGSNDPAFIDGAIPGTDKLMADNPKLKSEVNEALAAGGAGERTG